MANHTEVPLSQGYVALVDVEDYEDISQFNWHVLVQPSWVYALRTIPLPDGRWVTEYMHRRLLSGAEKIDHINGDGLDNRRANLRPATVAENARNRRDLNANNTSGYRGVSWRKDCQRWHAQIRVDGRKRHLGFYDDPREAARVFDAAAIELFGEFTGYLNFPALPDRGV